MLEADLRKLREPYSRPGLGGVGNGLERALDVHAPNIHHLYREVFSDLDSARGGIGWWTSQLTDRRRRLVSDYLVQSIWTVQYNLIEAGLHAVELREWISREADRLSAGARVNSSGRIEFKMPDAKCALDEIPQPMTDLHSAGLMRALGSAIDCLGASIVGVVALPLPILTSDFRQATSCLERIVKQEAGTTGAQAKFAATLRQKIAASGPEGWIEWATAYRHMFVHRARRMEGSVLTPRSQLVDHRGRPIIRVDQRRMLPRDPQASEVDVWRRPDRVPVLTESAEVTFAGVLRSTVSLVDDVADDLRIIWDQRRSGTLELRQPESQWKQTEPMTSSKFRGYAPETAAYSPTMFMSNPEFAARLRAASLDDASRHQWSDMV